MVLNDVVFDVPSFALDGIEQELLAVIQNNPNITHLGLNGFNLNDPAQLFNELSLDLVSLELSDTGLEFLPLPLDQYSQLEVLDLSDNPLAFFESLFAQAQTLERLDLSGTILPDLSGLFDLENLTYLVLNDVSFDVPSFALDGIEQELLAVVQNNPGIIHLGLNGFNLNDSTQLFNELSLELVSLELSDTGLEFLPLSLDQYPQLEVLDLSDNPLEFLGPLESLESSLRVLNLSNTNLPTLNELLPLTALTSLSLNNEVAVNYSTQILNQILLNNERLTNVGLNGIQLQADSDLILDTIANSSVVELEIANIGAVDFVLPERLIERLQLLDVSNNSSIQPLNLELLNLELAEQLESLILDDNEIVDIDDLFTDFPALNFLSLLGNEAIACGDLDILVAEFGDNVEIVNPENCGVVQKEPMSSAALFSIISFILLNEQECLGVTEETTVVGDQEIFSQADLNALEGVTQIIGSLNLFTDSVASVELDFSPLNSLVVVTQDTNIDISALIDAGSLNCLTTVGGNSEL